MWFVLMSVDYREKYKFLKRKLKILVFEHESLTQEMEKSQRKLLKVARDNSFLLDRLLQYERVVFDSPADSDATISSDSDFEEPLQKKRNTGSVSSSAKSQKTDEQIKKEPADNSTAQDAISTESLSKEPLQVESNESKLDLEEAEVDMQMPADEDSKDR